MTQQYPLTEYGGLLVIGDPHLEGRVPGFRKDDYPNVVLEKLRWCLNYAASEHLLTVILGDLFHLPRDNPNWMLGELMQLFDHEVIGIYGNHDVRENVLTNHDTVSILAKAGRIRLLDGMEMYHGIIGARPVVIGGTAWGKWLPDRCDAGDDCENDAPLVFWLSHHDIIVPGYEDQGRITPREIPGVDVVINGHIHRRLESVQAGRTLWMTPGNISRRCRSDATKSHIPSVLRIDITLDGWSHSFVEVPYQPFDDVFHEAVADAQVDEEKSAFIAGLAELQLHRTETGEGLLAFLDRNLEQYDDSVAAEIHRLAEEVTQDG